MLKNLRLIIDLATKRFFWNQYKMYLRAFLVKSEKAPCSGDFYKC